MHRRDGFDGCFQYGFGPGTDDAFRIAEADDGLLWLCIGEYRGPESVSVLLEYALSRLDREQKEKAYKIYVTDSLWGIAHGKSIDTRYVYIIQPAKEETRTAGEVIEDIRKKLGEVK